MRVGFIGTGEITSAMVGGLAGRGHKILVSPRNAAWAAALAAAHPEVTVAPNDQVVAGSDAFWPAMPRKCLPACRSAPDNR